MVSAPQRLALAPLACAGAAGSDLRGRRTQAPAVPPRRDCPVASWPSSKPRTQKSKLETGFTIVELIVVISIMVLVLAVAVPGLSAIAAESRFSAAVQLTSGALTNAYTSAVADLNVTAVRFVPGKWDNDPSTSAEQGSTQRQHIVTYKYTPTTAANPADPNEVVFGEYFQRQAGTPSVILPEDVWVAPVEALGHELRSVRVMSGGTLVSQQFNNFGRDFVVASDPHDSPFAVDAADMTKHFYQADDFLIVFDPRLGLNGVVGPNRLRGYIPSDADPSPGAAAIDSDGVGNYGATRTPLQRYNFTGVALYHRDAFLKGTMAGVAPAAGDDRRNWLRKNSRPFLVHRFGGGLVTGTQGGSQ